jgi:hypothetical protein
MSRVASSLRKNFSTVPNDLVNDDTISHSARFLFILLASQAETFVLYQKWVLKKMGWKDAATLRKYWSEIEDAGWGLRQRRRLDNGKLGVYDYELFIQPRTVSAQDDKKPTVENSPGGKKPTVDKTPPLNNTKYSNNTNFINNTNAVHCARECLDLSKDEDLARQSTEATQEKEKSSAQKESGHPAPTDDTSEQDPPPAKVRQLNQRSFAEAAKLRAEKEAASGTPATLSDTPETRKHFYRQHVEYLTKTDEGRADWQDIREEVGAKDGELVRPHSTVKYLANNPHVSIRKVACRDAFVQLLGGSARTQLNIDRKAAKNSQPHSYANSRRQSTSGPQPIVTEDTILQAIALSRARVAEENERAAAWG